MGIRFERLFLDRRGWIVIARIPLIAVIAELRRVNRPNSCLAVSDLVIRWVI